jgi:signal transduction histidine kinase/integral membrane sensor domain MASE1
MTKFRSAIALRDITPSRTKSERSNVYCDQDCWHNFPLSISTSIAIPLLTFIYYLSAKLGLLLAVVNPSATAMWPPTGIALAALLLLGYRVWPAIFIGAFLANITTAGSVATSIGIALGNTLEGISGAYLLNRFANGRNAFNRPLDIFKFAFYAGMLTSMVSPTFGVTTMYLGGYAEWSDFGSIWLTWWLGDASGAVIMAPLFILWVANPHVRWSWNQTLEAALLLALLFVDGFAVFGGLLHVTAGIYPLAFLSIPILVCTAFRFGQRETVTANFMLSAIAIIGTLRGFGPFVSESANESLLLLQIFMGVIGVMVMALAASISEHRRAEEEVRKLNAELEARVVERTAALHERTALFEDANRKLREESDERKRAEEQTRRNLNRIEALREVGFVMATTLDLASVLDILMGKIDLLLPYSTAAITLINRTTGKLEPAICWSLNQVAWRAGAWQFEQELNQKALTTMSPFMIRDVQTAGNVGLRRKGALVSFLGIPLVVKKEVLGVISFYTHEEHQFDQEEITFLTSLANQAAIAIRHAQFFEQSRAQATELEKANQVKSEFLNIMSHELRTPLNVVMGYTAMVKDGMLGAISSEQKKALEKVLNRSNELLAMINNILQATQMEAGQTKTESYEVNLVKFLDELRLVYDFPMEKELTLSWDYPSDLPTIKTDKGKLRQILENIINNALKFTLRGTIAVSTRYLPDAQAVQVRVVDTGIGISKDSLPTIFELFRQVDSSGTRSYDGVGIGLYIVKRFVELLNGKVEVESEPGRGSMFTVTIPCRT